MDKKKLFDEIYDAHKYSFCNKKQLDKDKVCGCFYCCNIYEPSDIEDYIMDDGGLTAVCPRCDVDSVIGESSGYPITEEFLNLMKSYWFGVSDSAEITNVDEVEYDLLLSEIAEQNHYSLDEAKKLFSEGNITKDDLLNRKIYDAQRDNWVKNN